MAIEQSKSLRKNLRNNPTPQELILWSKLKQKQFGYKFRRQHSFGKYIVDFYCKEKKLIIELDGWQHQEQEKYDTERGKYLERQGLKVLRFWNNEINTNLDGVLLKIMEHLQNP